MEEFLLRLDYFIKLRKVNKLRKKGRQIITVHEGKYLTGWIVL